MNQDIAKEADLYEDALELTEAEAEAVAVGQGGATAQRDLGFRKLEGLGIERDPEAALNVRGST